MAQWPKCATVNSTIVGGFPLGELKYWIFLFCRSDNKAKCGVELRAQHATSQEFGENRGTKYLNQVPSAYHSRILCAIYSVKLITQKNLLIKITFISTKPTNIYKLFNQIHTIKKGIPASINSWHQPFNKSYAYPLAL